MGKRIVIGELRKKIRKIEKYLGPIMDYHDDGIGKIPTKNRPESIWIYEYYQILKERYYRRIKRKKNNK